MRIAWDRKLLIWAILSMLSVFMLRSKTFATSEIKLLASEGAAQDYFGFSVSISGDVALVGAYGDGSRSGSAYVFRWNGSTWVEEQKLLASDGARYNDFGYSLSISGDVALVGAKLDGDKGYQSGSAYVFRWNGSSWVEEQKLLASDGAASDHFGCAVSISGDMILVGAEADDDNGNSSGSAYVFRWNGSSWVEEQKLLASDGASYNRFGHSVSISGDVALVGRAGQAYVFHWNGSSWVETQKLLPSGARGQFGRAVSISGDVLLVGAETDNLAYVFRWNGSSWVEEQKLLASDGAASDYFGFSVSISGDAALVGAFGHTDKGFRSGSAYVFRWNGSSWVEEQKLLASDGASEDQFGISVSISGDVALVGAYLDDDKGADSGSAYVYALEAGDEPYPSTIQFIDSTYNFPETGSNTIVTVSRNIPNLGAGVVSVNYATSNGTAIAGIDYVATSGVLTWGDGDTAPKTFSVQVLRENTKTVQLQLSNPTGLATLGTPSVATLTLVKLSASKVFVADLLAPGENPTDHGSIIQVEPVTGNQTIISSGGLFQGGPQDIAMDKNGDLIVTVNDVVGAPAAVIRINRITGNQTIISQGGFINYFVRGLAIEKNGDLIVGIGAGQGSIPRLVRIDPNDGSQSSLTTGIGARDVAIESNGQILAINQGVIHRVDPTTGLYSIVSSGGELNELNGIALDTMGNIFVTSTINTGTPYSRYASNIVKVNSLTGSQSVIFNYVSFSILQGIAVDFNGDLIVSRVVESSSGGLLRVDPGTGTYENISPTPSSENEFRIPLSIVIAPLLQGIDSGRAMPSIQLLLLGD